MRKKERERKEEKAHARVDCMRKRPPQTTQSSTKHQAKKKANTQHNTIISSPSFVKVPVYKYPNLDTKAKTQWLNMN